VGGSVALSDNTSNAVGGHAEYQGVTAKFPLDGVRELRGEKGDREFMVVVIGSGIKETTFRVKQKHFEQIP
jgi:hypothetical protein